MAHSKAAQQGKTHEFWVGFQHGTSTKEIEAELTKLFTTAYGAELTLPDFNSALTASEKGCYVLLEVAAPLTESGRAALRAAVLSGVLNCDVWYDPFPNFYHGEAAVHGSAVVMDMDMTSVQIEGIDEIARRLGVYEQVAAITEQAMQGHLDFSQSLQRRVALLQGGNAQQVIADVRSHMPWTPGLDQLIAEMDAARQANDKTQFCVASGGFHNLIAALDEHAHYNQVSGPIVDGQAKAALVRSLKEHNQIEKSQIIVVGDGANDLIMMAEGGFALAYHAKPKVQAQVHNLINHCDLTMLAARIKLDQAAQPETLLKPGEQVALVSID